MKLNTISRDQIKARLDAQTPTTLIEALPPRYFEQAHLPGAINIPHDQVRDMAPTLLPDMNATIVVYCANTPCQNSKMAAITLNQLGYTEVYEYVEGKVDWEEAGLSLEGAATASA